MYARLSFSSTATAWQKCRDIARIIHESSSGTASLSNLEFISVADSEFIAGANSGWTLAGAQTIATGTPSASDGNYIFESDCVDTNKKKYVSIRPNGNISNATIGNNFNAGIFLAPVVDYGTGTVNYVGGYSGTDNNYSRCAGVGSSGGNIHIIASPRKLVLIGNSTNGTYQQLELYMEFAETGQTQYHNLVPTCKITDNTYDAIAFTNFDTGGNLLPTWYGTGNGYYRNTSVNVRMIQFPKSLRKSYANNTIRLLNLSTTNAASADYLSWLAYLEDGTTTGSNAGQVIGPTVQTISPLNFHSRYFRMKVLGSKRQFQEIDAGRNIIYPLYPFKCEIPQWYTGIIDFELAGVYQSVAGLGLIGDKVQLGSTDYLIWNATATSGTTLLRIE